MITYRYYLLYRVTQSIARFCRLGEAALWRQSDLPIDSGQSWRRPMDISDVGRSAIGPTPFIPREEYALRIERLKEGMRGQQLDAILLGTGMNFQYFSGFPSPARNVARPFFLLV